MRIAALPLLVCAVVAGAGLLVSRPALTAPSAGADPALVEAGRSLATAGDCAACHGEDFKGGDAIAIPMGKVYASNITPDLKTGIGAWSLQDFTGVMRRGVAPGGRRIYPAMPYTSYTALSDDQIRAIWSYLRLGVRPVAYVPPKTSLPFPFIRPAMIGWNALFLREGRSEGAVPVTGPQLQRGRLLVETLEHCTACHTPRGMLMQPLSGKHLSGAFEGGWWAPNITGGAGGIGDWSDAQLRRFLTTGHTDVAIAGDDMGTAVKLSLSRLPPDDISAIIAYLRAVPAKPSSRAAPPASPGGRLDVAALEAAPDAGWKAMLAHDTTRGDLLYQDACAACHGADGNGSAGLQHPSLRLIRSVRAPDGASLVQAIAGGVDLQVGDTHRFMPPFRTKLTDAQIATLATYVRTTFGGVNADISAGSVGRILDGRVGTPWLILNATWLSIVGLALGALVAVAVLVVLVRWVARRR